MIERKSYKITNLKTDDVGTIEAIVSVFGNIDSGNEVVMPGFFQKSIEKKLPKGVWSHDWKQPIAKTLEARELLPGDSLLPIELRTLGGAYIKGQFNLETQRGKEAYSDIKFGIIDEFSIGYSVVKDKKNSDTGARELIEGDWKEWSPVLVGMNDKTSLISIKSETENKGMLAEEMAQTTPSTWEVQSAFSRVISKIAEGAKNSDITGEFDWKAKATVACSELGSELTPLVISQIEEFLNSSDDEFYLKGITGTESFESFESAGAALEKFAQKMRSNYEIRTKEGRVLSSSNRAKVQACMDAMSAVMADLQNLMDMSEPKPKAKEMEMDVEALRTQAMRLNGQVMATLSR